MIIKPVYLWTFLISILFFSACKEKDDYVYPPVRTDLICLFSTVDGGLTSFFTDGGKTYSVENAQRFKGLTPDSLYRMQCLYEVREDSITALVYSLRTIPSWHPLPIENLKTGLKTDPVDVESIWYAGGYINIAVLVKKQNTAHYYGFIEESITQNGGKKILNLIFYHDRNEDLEAYTERIYFSIPLHNYQHILQPGDMTLLTINTYKNDLTTYSFLY